MYLQELIEVAIGLIFAWLLLSIAVLQVQEVIATVFKKRAKDLESAIGNMLKDDTYLEDFYHHPLIQGLIEPISQDKLRKLKKIEAKDQKQLTLWEKYKKWAYTREKTASKNRKPSYIPAANFSAALFDIVANAGTERSPIKSTVDKLNAEVNTFRKGEKETAKALLDSIYQLGQAAANSPAGSYAQNKIKIELKEQIRSLSKKYPTLSPHIDEFNQLIDEFQFNLKALFTSDQLIEQVSIGMKSIFEVNSDSNLGKSLRSLMAGANEYATNSDKALAIGRKNVEDWFNNTMDRMGGWYKRWAQFWAFVIGFFLALILNVDSVYIAQELWRTPATRQASTAYIQSFVEEQAKADAALAKANLQKIESEIQRLNFPIGWVMEPYTGTETVKLFAAPNEVAGICPKLFDTNSSEPGVQSDYCYKLNNPPQDLAAILVKIFGFFMTALATMQGAPFWFDILKKFVNVRGTGTNPAEKPASSAPTEREKV